MINAMRMSKSITKVQRSILPRTYKCDFFYV